MKKKYEKPIVTEEATYAARSNALESCGSLPQSVYLSVDLGKECGGALNCSYGGGFPSQH